MAGSISVEGLNKTIRTLRKVDAEMGPEIKKINLDLAESLVPVARSLVPVQSGALRDSIRAAGQQRTGVVRAGKARVPYAGPIHFGWPKQHIRPQPFLYDALDQRRSAIMSEYVERIQKLIDRST